MPHDFVSCSRRLIDWSTNHYDIYVTDWSASNCVNLPRDKLQSKWVIVSWKELNNLCLSNRWLRFMRDSRGIRYYRRGVAWTDVVVTEFECTYQISFWMVHKKEKSGLWTFVPFSGNVLISLRTFWDLASPSLGPSQSLLRNVSKVCPRTHTRPGVLRCLSCPEPNFRMQPTWKPENMYNLPLTVAYRSSQWRRHRSCSYSNLGRSRGSSMNYYATPAACFIPSGSCCSPANRGCAVQAASRLITEYKHSL